MFENLQHLVLRAKGLLFRMGLAWTYLFKIMLSLNVVVVSHNASASSPTFLGPLKSLPKHEVTKI